MHTPSRRSAWRSPVYLAPAGVAVALLFALGGPALAQVEAAADGPDRSTATSDEAAEIGAADQELIDRILDLQLQIHDLRDQLTAASRALLDEKLFDQELARLGSERGGDTESSEAAQQEAVGKPEPPPETQPETATELNPQPAIEAGAESSAEARPADDGCNTLRLLDTTGDGILSGSDRFWRYLRLWIDGNRDGIVQESEALHPFEFGIIEISGRLNVFHTDKKGVGDIRRDDRLYFEPLGKKRETGILMVDATRIQRGDGLNLLAEDRERLEGLQAFRAGLSLRAADGETLHLNCP